MDRETEKQLNLYLDGLLSGVERKAFEIRLETDPELRKAVELHRQAAAEMKKFPGLPEGFAARARARLDETHPETAAGRFWSRFWTLETAGLLAAAGIVAAVLFPLLKTDQTGQVFPRKPVADFPAAPAPEPIPEDEATDPAIEILQKNQPARALSADDRREAGAPVPEAARRMVRDESAQDKGEPAEASSARDSDEFIEGLPVIDREFTDILTLESGVAEEIEAPPKERATKDPDQHLAADAPAAPSPPAGKAQARPAAEGRERAAAPAGEKKIAAEPLPGPTTTATGERKDSSLQAAAPAESFAGDMAALAEKDAGPKIPFRVVTVPGTVDLEKRGSVSLKTEADFDFLKHDDPAEKTPRLGRLKVLATDQAREDSLLWIDLNLLGIDLKKEMGVLITAHHQGDPPVRIEVTGARLDKTRILIRYREVPVSADDPSWRLLPDYQVVILPASELPIELQKID